MLLNLNLVIGVVFVFLGLIANVAGIGGGIIFMINDSQARAQSIQLSSSFILKFIQALTVFLKALAAAPSWLVVNFMGLVFLLLGVYFLGQDNICIL